MALLGDIRKRSWLLIIGIGLPLVAFLIGDAFSGGNMFGNPNELGSVDGHPINLPEYNKMYNQVSQNPQFQGASSTLIAQRTWDMLVADRIVMNEADELGLRFTDQQYYQAAGYFFRTVQPDLVGANGRVNLEATKQFLSQLKAAAQSGNPQAQEFYSQWENYNPQSDMLRNDFVSLVSAGVLATDAEANFAYQAGADKEDISYAYVDYKTFNEKNKITVSDDQIVDYLKKHKKQFRPQPTVNIAYAYYPANASETDVATITKELNSYLAPQIIKDEANQVVDSIASFANAKNDSVFVTRFSDDQFDPNYYTKDQINAIPNPELRNLLSDVQVGKVYGPVKSNDVYQLIKISKSKPITDSAKTSHILISYQGAQNSNATRSPQEAQKLADSILTEVNINPSKFNEFASTISDDKVAAMDHGNIGWVGRNQQGFAQTYRDFAVSNPVGTIELVPSQFGFHIIRIDDAKAKTGYQIATIRKHLKASEETQEKIFNTSNQLALDAQGKSANEFINAARKSGAEVNSADGVDRFAFNVVGLNSTQKLDDILNWAFDPDTNVGNVERFDTLEGGQIIVYLTNRYDKDNYNVAAYRNDVESLIQNRLAAEKAKELVGNNKDLNAVAKALGGKTGTATGISYNSANIPSVGVEPMVGATAMGMKEGQVSNVIKGNNGIFVIKVDRRTKGAKKDNVEQEMNAVHARNVMTVQQQLIPSFMMNADIEDTRIEKLRK